MEEKYSGIVLNAVSYGEFDKLLNIFTLEKGIVFAKIKSVKKAGAKMKFASEPFCFAEFVCSFKGNNKSIIGASLIDSFYPIRNDIRKFFAATTITEFAKRFLKEGIVAETLFMTMIDALKKLAYKDDMPEITVVSFLLDALKETGYAININGCCACGHEIEGRIFFDYASGGFLCEKCAENTHREINFSTYEALKEISKNNQVSLVKAVKCLKLLNYYIQQKPEETIKSLQELIKLSDLR